MTWQATVTSRFYDELFDAAASKMAESMDIEQYLQSLCSAFLMYRMLLLINANKTATRDGRAEISSGSAGITAEKMGIFMGTDHESGSEGA